MVELEDKITNLKQEFETKLQDAQNISDLENVRIEFLGRQGKIAALMKELKNLSLEEKKEFGPKFNILKQETEAAYQEKKDLLGQKKIDSQNLRTRFFDVTSYIPNQIFGNLHPYTEITRQVEDIFISMGYEIADGPEVEHDHYNFDALNIPEDHPSKEEQDTFWLNIPGMILRTQTSPVQARYMEKNKPPIAIIAPGRTYRHEATDASHDFMFSQVEGLFIDKNVSLSNLLATLKIFIQTVFESKNIDIRIRPGYFPFVEPGVEVDFSCPFCKIGCSVCKKSTWIELVPAGLVHPNVLKYSGIDPEKYSGFAFGLGLTRLVMLKYGINDIRLLHNNNIDFLQQFKNTT